MTLLNWIIGNEVPLILGITGLGVFFFSKWILAIKIKDDRYRNFLSVGMTCVFTPVIYVVFIISMLCSNSYYEEICFDQKEWFSNTEERFKMSEDIIDTEMLIGKTRSEVIEILGDEYTSNSQYNIRYYIGFVPGMFRIDPDVLDIRFANGVVAEVRQQET